MENGLEAELDDELGWLDSTTIETRYRQPAATDTWQLPEPAGDVGSSSSRDRKGKFEASNAQEKIRPV